MRHTIALFISALLSTAALLACETTVDAPMGESHDDPVLRLANLLQDDTDGQLLRLVHTEMTAAITGNPSAEAIRRVARSGNERAFQALMGWTDEDLERWDRLIARSKAGLLRKHPEIGELARAAKAVADEATSREYRTAKAARTDSCKWVQFTASLYLCTYTTPIGYWICAYVSYCQLCEDQYRVCY